MRLKLSHIAGFIFILQTSQAVKDSEDGLRTISEKITNFSALLGAQVLEYALRKKINVVFSPFKVFLSLSRIQKMASPNVKEEIRDLLGLCSVNDGTICELLNNLTHSYRCYGVRNFTLVYKRFLFFDFAMDPSPTSLTDSCYGDQFHALNFTEKNHTRLVINDQYSKLSLNPEAHYLTTPLPDTTRALFMEVLYFSDLSRFGYVPGGIDQTVDILDQNVESTFIRKSGVFDHYGMAIDYETYRDDLPGDRFSVFIVKLVLGSETPPVRMKRLFTPEKLQEILTNGFEKGVARNMTLKFPALPTMSSIDLRQPLENLYVMSLFTRNNPMRGMFKARFYMEEFPHFEQMFFGSQEEVNGGRNNYEGFVNETIRTAFWFLVVDKNRRLPITGALQLGFV